MHPSAAPQHRWSAFSLLATTQFFLVLDAAIVLVALPSIGTDLEFAPEDLSWVVNAYALTFGGLLMLGGRLSDLLGRRRLFIIGLGLFAIASLLGALASSALFLIAARALQGVGAAIVSPAALSLVMTLFTDTANRNKALGLWGAVAGMGAAAGSVLGGFLTEWFGWQAVLWVNVPLAVVALALASRLLPEGRSVVSQRSFDLAGAFTLTTGLAVLIYGLVEAENVGWGSGETIGVLGLAGVLLIAFGVIETRSASPLVPPRMLRFTALRNANVLTLLTTSAMFSFFFFMTLYAQQVLGYGPIEAGLAALPVPVMIASLAAPIAKLVTRIGYRVPPVVGLLILGAGLLWFAQIPVDGDYVTDVLGPILVTAVGAALAVIPLMIAATSGVPETVTGLASGLINTTQQLGGALGVAVLGSIAVSTTNQGLANGDARPQALIDGFSAGLTAGAVIAWGAALLAIVLFARGGRDGAPPTSLEEPGGDDAAANQRVAALV